MSDPAPSRNPLRALLARADGLETRFLLRSPPPGVLGRLLRAVQSVVLASRRYREDHAGDRAAALAFATLLSMLPLLLLALSVFGAAGVQQARLDAVREWLLENFLPETARGLQGSFEGTLADLRTASRGLGIAGGVLLLAAGWKLYATLQRTFEQIWGVRDFRSRLRRLIGFWGTLLLAPFLVTASVVLSGRIEAAAARGEFPPGNVSQVVSLLLPAVPGWIGVLLVYRFCAGRASSWRSAVLGATAATACWEWLKIGFAFYVKRAFVTRTLVAGMGVLPVFLVWLYLSWVAFLLGAELAFVANGYDDALRRTGLRREGET